MDEGFPVSTPAAKRVFADEVRKIIIRIIFSIEGFVSVHGTLKLEIGNLAFMLLYC
jgi:hypothetical protein